MGDDVTLLFDYSGGRSGGDLPSSMRAICRAMSKKEGGPWECYNTRDCTGWEADKVVVVTGGEKRVLERVTRAKTHLILILVKPKGRLEKFYEDWQGNLEKAAQRGLVDLGLSD